MPVVWHINAKMFWFHKTQNNFTLLSILPKGKQIIKIKINSKLLNVTCFSFVWLKTFF